VFVTPISSGYSLDVPIDNMICDSNVDLGYEDNEFNTFGGDVDDCVSLGCFRGYDPFIGPYCVCLEDLPRKIMWFTFFNPSYDFSEAIDKVKMILVVFGVIFVICSYLLFSKLWYQEFDMLLCALAMFDLMRQVLKS